MFYGLKKKARKLVYVPHYFLCHRQSLPGKSLLCKSGPGLAIARSGFSCKDQNLVSAPGSRPGRVDLPISPSIQHEGQRHLNRGEFPAEPLDANDEMLGRCGNGCSIEAWVDVELGRDIGSSGVGKGSNCRPSSITDRKGGKSRSEAAMCSCGICRRGRWANVDAMVIGRVSRELGK